MWQIECFLWQPRCPGLAVRGEAPLSIERERRKSFFLGGRRRLKQGLDLHRRHRRRYKCLQEKGRASLLWRKYFASGAGMREGLKTEEEEEVCKKGRKFNFGRMR